MVQETGTPRPLFALNPNRAFNPASVMKLVTTLAALELLGPDFRWKTDAFLDGPLEAGVLRGNLVLKGRGDPKITRGALAGVHRDAARERARRRRRRSGARPLVLRADRPRSGARFDGEPRKPYNVGPDALLVNFKSVKFGFAPSGSADAVELKVEPALAQVAVGPPPRIAAGDCGDWQAAVRAAFVDRGTRADAVFTGLYPASCGEREWWVSLLDHPAYVHGMFDT